jgi:1,2-diacylglycerol 3-alpha-glucosyltransferase
VKVALFSESYLPYLNGVSISIRILQEELTRRGHEVWVYAPRFRHYRDESPFVRRFPSFYTPFEPDYPIGWLWSPSLWREWRQQRFDLVHTHTPFFVGMAGARWARRTRTPLVSTFHTLYEEYLHYLPRLVPRRLVRRLLRWHLRRYYEQVDAIMTPSQIGAEVLRRYGIRKAITPIRNPVLPFPTMSQEQARAALGIPQEVWMLLYVGRMAPEKNVHLLLHAMPHVVRGCPKGTPLAGRSRTCPRIVASTGGRPESERAGLFHRTGATRAGLTLYVGSRFIRLPLCHRVAGLGVR